MNHTPKPETRTAALQLAVVLHAASNLAQGAIPPGTDTVIRTADKFLTYIERGSAK